MTKGRLPERGCYLCLNTRMYRTIPKRNETLQGPGVCILGTDGGVAKRTPVDVCFGSVGVYITSMVGLEGSLEVDKVTGEFVHYLGACQSDPLAFPGDTGTGTPIGFTTEVGSPVGSG